MRINRQVGAAQYELLDLRTGKKTLRHGEHIVAKRQADINRWMFPECDEPFPQERIDDDYDPVLESRPSQTDDSSDDTASDSDPDSDDDPTTYADLDDDPVGDADSSQGGREETGIPEAMEVNQPVEGGILRNGRTHRTGLNVNFNPISTVKEFSSKEVVHSKDSDQLEESVEPDHTGSTASNIGRVGESTESESVRSKSSNANSTTSSPRKWMGDMLRTAKRKLRSLPRKDYSAMHKGKH